MSLFLGDSDKLEEAYRTILDQRLRSEFGARHVRVPETVFQYALDLMVRKGNIQRSYPDENKNPFDELDTIDNYLTRNINGLFERVVEGAETAFSHATRCIPKMQSGIQVVQIRYCRASCLGERVGVSNSQLEIFKYISAQFFDIADPLRKAFLS